MRCLPVLALLLSVSAVVAVRPAAAQVPTADVTGGTVRGAVAGELSVFKGIPFAAPPVGDLRWRPPQPVVPWAGVRDALAFGPAPMQYQPAVAVAAGMMGLDRVGEDCLYLNVWSAAKTAGERRPVMVWIYGGAFVLGSTGMPMYDGGNLARRGVVVVSVAYRVGPFGFLAHPELSRENGGHGSGCYGIQDQIAGLKWVRDNVARFGGDPANVTIFGESAGGESVNILAGSPAAAGLFHRAICESGGFMAPARRADGEVAAGPLALPYAEAKGVSYLAKLGVADVGAARKLPADAIQRVKFDPCWPAADGPTIPGDLFERFEHGQFNDVPVLLGTNTNDGAMFAPVSTTPAAFERLLRRQPGGGADGILAAYPHATAAEASRSNRELVRDWIFAWPTWSWARLQSRYGKGRAYLYSYNYTAPRVANGAGHTAELPYVFGHLGGLFNPAASAENRAVSDQLMSYWTRFATTGDPNGPGLPAWPAFDERADTTLIIDRPTKVGPTPNLEQLQALDVSIGQARAQRRTPTTAP